MIINMDQKSKLFIIRNTGIYFINMKTPAIIISASIENIYISNTGSVHILCWPVFIWIKHRHCYVSRHQSDRHEYRKKDIPPSSVLFHSVHLVTDNNKRPVCDLHTGTCFYFPDFPIQHLMPQSHRKRLYSVARPFFFCMSVSSHRMHLYGSFFDSSITYQQCFFHHFKNPELFSGLLAVFMRFTNDGSLFMLSPGLSARRCNACGTAGCTCPCRPPRSADLP